MALFYRLDGVVLRAYAWALEIIYRIDFRQVFDRKFYLERYGDVARAGVDPLGHFLRDGGRERRQPHPLFDTEYYLASNPNVAASGMNPLVHYLRYGCKEGLRPNVLFDAEWYRAHHPELRAGANPFVDFLRRRAAGEIVAGGPRVADFLREQETVMVRKSGGVGEAVCRFRVTAQRLRDAGRPVILAIEHALGGGAVQYLEEVNRHLRGRAEFIALTPSPGSAVILEALNPLYEFRIVVDPIADYAGLLEALRLCGVQRVHIQHTHGYVPGLPERLVHDLGAPFDFSAHDYYTICPQVTLTDAAGQYCGEPDEAGCRRCLEERPPWPPRDIATWRQEHAWLLNRAERAIAPSEDTAGRLRTYFPAAAIVAAAHPEGATPAQARAPRLGRDEAMRVVVIGALSPHKGLHRLRACAGEAQRRGLPLEFALIGYVDAKVDGRKCAFRQTGPYRQEQLPAMLADADPHLVWFPAQGPETYSFTLSAALEAGLPVAIPDLGAMAERAGGRAWTWVVPWQWDTRRLLEFFLIVREDLIRGCTPTAPQRQPGARSDFYESEYLRPLTPAAAVERPQ